MHRCVCPPRFPRRDTWTNRELPCPYPPFGEFLPRRRGVVTRWKKRHYSKGALGSAAFITKLRVSPARFFERLHPTASLGQLPSHHGFSPILTANLRASATNAAVSGV